MCTESGRKGGEAIRNLNLKKRIQMRRGLSSVQRSFRVNRFRLCNGILSIGSQKMSSLNGNESHNEEHMYLV